MAKHATLRYLRVSVRKIHPLAKAIRGTKVEKAFDYLAFSKKAAARPLRLLLKSALSNATKEKGVDVDRLYVKELQVCQGPSMKRSRPRSRGMANPILKRTCHITVVLDEK